MTAHNQIVAALAEVFAPMDEKVLADNRNWGLRRRDAIKAKKAELSGQRRALGEFAYYEQVFAAAGGKTWYNILKGASDATVTAAMDKNTNATAAKRNASIAAKLIKAEVTEVVSSSFAFTTDGFDGTFHVETNAGKKIVRVNTIFAGGYNIQCLHLRVLVTVK